MKKRSDTVPPTHHRTQEHTSSCFHPPPPTKPWNSALPGTTSALPLVTPGQSLKLVARVVSGNLQAFTAATATAVPTAQLQFLSTHEEFLPPNDILGRFELGTCEWGGAERCKKYKGPFRRFSVLRTLHHSRWQSL